ncbi:anti-sigma factor [Acidimangrovimonas pyrenivorans]|uniref:Anti-sigma factor domain-containing protein n=1 Tax=Acidimangrovimonas pyrenivorans TaxID=2030798 RepID=A0ABV7AGE5_9RHOB
MNESPISLGPGADSRDDVIAAEYVLGTLPRDERLVAEHRIEEEPDFAALVADWEHRFSPLNMAYEPEHAPDLLPQIEARIFGTPARVQQRNLMRLAWVLVGGALAAVALLTLVMNHTDGFDAPADRYAATIEARGMPLVFAAAWSAETKELQVSRTVGLAAEKGRDYELWLIAKGGVPISLGLLRGGVTKLSLPALRPGAVLAVSLEPIGGSRTGAPTGPVLVTGPLTKL